MKDYIENEYEDLLKLVNDHFVEKINLLGGIDEKDIDMLSLLADLESRKYKGNCNNEEDKKQENY
jgi:hypothetical protein